MKKSVGWLSLLWVLLLTALLFACIETPKDGQGDNAEILSSSSGDKGAEEDGGPLTDRVFDDGENTYIWFTGISQIGQLQDAAKQGDDAMRALAAKFPNRNIPEKFENAAQVLRFIEDVGNVQFPHIEKEGWKIARVDWMCYYADDDAGSDGAPVLPPQVRFISLSFEYESEHGDTASFVVSYKSDRPKTVKEYFASIGGSAYIVPEPDLTCHLASGEEVLYFDRGFETDTDPGVKFLFTENSAVALHFTCNGLSSKEEKWEFIRAVLESAKVTTINEIIGG